MAYLVANSPTSVAIVIVLFLFLLVVQGMEPRVSEMQGQESYILSPNV